MQAPCQMLFMDVGGLLIVVMTCTCSPYPRRKLTALLVSRIDGEMNWLNTNVFASEFFQSRFPGLFLIPLLLVYVKKASRSVLSDCQP
jgi:hypothetical protein